MPGITDIWNNPERKPRERPFSKGRSKPPSDDYRKNGDWLAPLCLRGDQNYIPKLRAMRLSAVPPAEGSASIGAMAEHVTPGTFEDTLMRTSASAGDGVVDLGGSARRKSRWQLANPPPTLAHHSVRHRPSIHRSSIVAATAMQRRKSKAPPRIKPSGSFVRYAVRAIQQHIPAFRGMKEKEPTPAAVSLPPVAFPVQSAVHHACTPRTASARVPMLNLTDGPEWTAWGPRPPDTADRALHARMPHSARRSRYSPKTERMAQMMRRAEYEATHYAADEELLSARSTITEINRFEVEKVLKIKA